MDFSFVSEYISPIILIICLAIGYIIKNCIPGEGINKFIPLIVAIIGVIICAWEAMEITPQIIAIGLISGLSSTGLYELFKQFINGNNDINDKLLNAQHIKDDGGDNLG